MNSEQLAQALKITPIKAEEWIDAINETFERFDISTPERQACFLGQCAHESGGFATLKENLNYSAEGLTKVWPKRFPSLEAAQPYHRNPEKIANKVYADRMGNGDEASGEGFKYRGRGLIQLTGKDNYTRCGAALGLDLVNNPDLLLEPLAAARSAGSCWRLGWDGTSHFSPLRLFWRAPPATARVSSSNPSIGTRSEELPKRETRSLLI